MNKSRFDLPRRFTGTAIAAVCVAVLSVSLFARVPLYAGTPDKNPLLSDPILLRGVEAYMSGDYDKCYSVFLEATKKNPELAPPAVLMAMLFSSDGKYAKMQQYLDRAASEYPDDPETFFQLAGIAVREERFVEARILIEKGQSLLKPFLRKRKAAGISPDRRGGDLTREMYSLQANLAEKKGDYAVAEKFIRQVVAENADDGEGWTSLGFLLHKQGKNDEARKAFDRAWELKSLTSPGWLVLARLLQQSGKTDEAKRLVEKNYDEKNVTEDELAQIVRLYLKWNRIDDAAKTTDRLLERNANSVVGWTLQGEIALFRSAFVAAENDFRKAILLDSGSFDASNGMALALGDQRNHQKMLEAFRIARTNWEHNPLRPEAVATYAWTLYLLGQRDEAERLFAPMLEKGQITSTIAYYLAEIAHSKGATALALNFIELALKQDEYYAKHAATLELRDLVLKKAPQ